MLRLHVYNSSEGMFVGGLSHYTTWHSNAQNQYVCMMHFFWVLSSNVLFLGTHFTFYGQIQEIMELMLYSIGKNASSFRKICGCKIGYDVKFKLFCRYVIPIN